MSALAHPGDLFFAYGTLKKGGEYEWIMRKAGGVFVGRAHLETPYPLILDRYPCLLDQPGEGYQVKGEVYRIDDPDGWHHLDRLEDHPREYVRRLEQVLLSGDSLVAWTYFYRWPELLEPGLLAVEEFQIASGSNKSV